METVYFLIFIGICAFAFVWASRKTKAETELAKRKARKDKKDSHSLLATPADNRLAHKEEIWNARRKRAKKGVSKPPPFVPRFESEAASQYDGYSRRDRHHLTVEEHIKREGHIDRVDDYDVKAVELRSARDAEGSQNVA